MLNPLLDKQALKEMLQEAINQKTKDCEISNIGNDSKVAIFKSYAGHLEKIWEGNYILCAKYIQTL